MKKRIEFSTDEVRTMLEALETRLDTLERLNYSAAVGSSVHGLYESEHEKVSALYSRLCCQRRKMESEDRIHASRN